MDLLNKTTGEVFEIQKEKVPFRTLLDHEFDHKEKYEKGSSQVDLTGYEPLDVIIARCTRTMVAPGGQVFNVLDVDAVKAESINVPASVDYEAGSAKTVDEAFATEDPTTDPDFDLTDASRIMSEISTRQEANDNLNVSSEADNVKIEEALDKSNDDTNDDSVGNKVVGE